MYFEKVSRAIFYEERRKEREGRSDKTAVHTSDNRAALYQDERNSCTDKKEIFGHHQFPQSIY